VLHVIGYHISPHDESPKFDSPSTNQEQSDSCSSAQDAIVRPKIAYIVPRESVLHARARAFSLRWGQIVTCSLPYSGVSEPSCLPRRPSWSFGQVRPNILTVAINFIIKLSKSTNLAIENKYSLILIIVDKFIKYLYIIACKKEFIIKQLKYIVLN